MISSISLFGLPILKKPLISYQSAIRPISQLLLVIDEASENINYQIQRRLTGQYALKVMVIPFRFDNSRKLQASVKDLFAADFPARYISYNLHNSKSYSISPYEYNNNTGLKSTTTDQVRKADVTVSGRVAFDAKGNCTISPVLYWGKDSLHVFETKGSIRKKDDLLEHTLHNLQAMLDATIDAGGLAEFRKLIASASEDDSKAAFERALADNKPALASYYIEQLATRPKGKKLANVYRSRLYYTLGDYTNALKYAQDCLTSDSVSETGHYLAARCNIKLSRFEAAKADLRKVKNDSREFADVLFLRGVCLYNQDSVHKALKDFNAQRTQNEAQVNWKSTPDLYAYIGFCYEWLGMWKDAERNYLKQWSSDSSSVSNRQYLIKFYDKYGLRLVKAKDHKNAYTYFMKSYGKSKQYGSLFGAVESSIRSAARDSEIERLIRLGIRDSVFQRQSIYLDLADLCRSEMDSANNFVPYYLRQAIRLLKRHIGTGEGNSGVYSALGSTYFRLNVLDSAEYFYVLAKNKNTTDPIHYFNLAELQTMRKKPTEALKTLDETNVKFINDPRYPYNDKEYLRALYYFYTIENKALQNASFAVEEKGFPESVAEQLILHFLGVEFSYVLPLGKSSW